MNPELVDREVLDLCHNSSGLVNMKEYWTCDIYQMNCGKNSWSDPWPSILDKIEDLCLELNSCLVFSRLGRIHVEALFDESLWVALLKWLGKRQQKFRRICRLDEVLLKINCWSLEHPLRSTWRLFCKRHTTPLWSNCVEAPSKEILKESSTKNVHCRSPDEVA